MMSGENFMRLNNLFLSIIGSLFLHGTCIAGAVTTLSLIEKDGVSTNNYPLTFGHVFKSGDVTQYVQVRYNGALIDTQCDIKSTYSGGSVRFAVISVVLPSVSANSTNTIALETASSTASSGGMDKTAILATNIEDEIRLSNLSGSGYGGSLTADLNAQIASDSSPAYWLQGSVATEILVRDGLNNSLEASWEVRFYPGTSFGPRVSHSIENMNADYRGIVNYNVDIQAGLPTLASKYSKSSVQHNENSRWRKVIWIGPEPPETELHYDIAYLISTGSVMNYDTSLSMQESTIASEYSLWNASDKDIMGSGLLEKDFPTTGARRELAILPKWSAMYLLSFDNRLKEMVVGHGEMSAHCPVHYRESNGSKTFYRHPISIDDRPTVFTREDYASDYGSAGDKLPVAIGNVGSTYHGWKIDRSHQGSFPYLPYLITGERYFLDEMYYWAFYNLSGCWDDTTYGRNLSYGWIQDEVRGEAWAFRNIVDAAAYAKDGDPEKTYLATKISNNITQWMTEKDRYPLNYWGIDVSGALDGLDSSSVESPTSPWMEDFMLLSLAHADEQGFSTKQIIDWYSSFIINRFTHPDFNHYNGAAYRFPAKLIGGSYPSTWSAADALYLSHPTSFPVDTDANNQRYMAMAAASTVTSYTGGQDAYNFIRGGIALGIIEENPMWGILPKYLSTGKLKSGSSKTSSGTGRFIQ